MPDKQNYITLNLSVPALERLMSECPELVVKLSQGVMEEYSRRQVKAFAQGALNEMVKKAMAAEIGTLNGCTLKLNPQFEAALKGVVSTQIATLKTDLLVEAATKAASVSAELSAKVEQLVTREVGAQTVATLRGQEAAKLQAEMNTV